jgi:hypothetical protein
MWKGSKLRTIPEHAIHKEMTMGLNASGRAEHPEATIIGADFVSRESHLDQVDKVIRGNIVVFGGSISRSTFKGEALISINPVFLVRRRFRSFVNFHIDPSRCKSLLTPPPFEFKRAPCRANKSATEH